MPFFSKHFLEKVYAQIILLLMFTIAMLSFYFYQNLKCIRGTFREDVTLYKVLITFYDCEMLSTTKTKLTKSRSIWVKSPGAKREIRMPERMKEGKTNNLRPREVGIVAILKANG